MKTGEEEAEMIWRILLYAGYGAAAVCGTAAVILYEKLAVREALGLIRRERRGFYFHMEEHVIVTHDKRREHMTSEREGSDI